jgi:hypothetical protein
MMRLLGVFLPIFLYIGQDMQSEIKHYAEKHFRVLTICENILVILHSKYQ